jgi:uncharacterized protein YjbI with pentapeptide repeats
MSNRDQARRPEGVRRRVDPLTLGERRRRRAAVVVGLVLSIALAGTVAVAPARDGRSSHGAPSAKRPHRIPVEVVLTAREARWSPGRRRGRGRLTLDRISPRMVMMARAPRRELAVVPASMLGANWHRLFRRQHGKTNVVLSVPVNGTPRLFAARVDLVARRKAGDRMTFRVLPLKRTAHRALPMGRSPHAWEDATLYVDPTVTDAIKAMWQQLLAFFAGETLAVPDNPTTRTGNTLTYRNRGVYAGPETADVSSAAAWQQVEDQILGAWVGDLTHSLFLRATDYKGLALFNHDFTTVAFDAVSPPLDVKVRDLALFESTADTLSFIRTEVGSANMRGLTARTLTVANSAFDTVDLTGSAIGDASAKTRSSITNAAFVNVETNRRVTDASGNPDTATRTLESGAPIVFRNTDFVSVSFQNVDFKGAGASSTTFQGCGLQNVDFKGAQMGGQSPAERDNTFEPTFDNSILEGVSFDGANLKNVSFNNVEFTGSTFNGATLENVDFTGATGLQNIDWTKVSITGNVYGLAQYVNLLDVDNPRYIRSLTFDGKVPEIDPVTGYDIEPGSKGYLIEPRSGVRFNPDTLEPIDPETGNPMQDPQTGQPLVFDTHSGLLINLDTGREFRVDYETGRLVDE